MDTNTTTAQIAKVVSPDTLSRVRKFAENNFWFGFFILSFGFMIWQILDSAYEHKSQVQEISKQNAACIYLESSKLGEGQHYMICEGEIVLKRLADGQGTMNVEQKLEEVVPTDPSNQTATTTPNTK